MQLDKQTTDVLAVKLRAIGMANLQEQVEKLLLGYASPVDAIRLLNSAYQLGWMAGQDYQNKVTTNLLNGIVNGKSKL